MKNKKRETVGKLSSDLLMKDMGPQNVVDMQRSMQETYLKDLVECIDIHKKIFPGDFYVVHITKKEKLLTNVIQEMFLGRMSCPSPQYDEAVYKYSKEDDRVEFMWVIPSKGTCHHLRDNAIHVVPEEQQLLRFVLEFFDGSLLARSKQLNKEEADSILIA